MPRRLSNTLVDPTTRRDPEQTSRGVPINRNPQYEGLTAGDHSYGSGHSSGTRNTMDPSYHPTSFGQQHSPTRPSRRRQRRSPRQEASSDPQRGQTQGDTPRAQRRGPRRNVGEPGGRSADVSIGGRYVSSQPSSGTPDLSPQGVHRQRDIGTRSSTTRATQESRRPDRRILSRRQNRRTQSREGSPPSAPAPATYREDTPVPGSPFPSDFRSSHHDAQYERVDVRLTPPGRSVSSKYESDGDMSDMSLRYGEVRGRRRQPSSDEDTNMYLHDQLEMIPVYGGRRLSYQAEVWGYQGQFEGANVTLHNIVYMLAQERPFIEAEHPEYLLSHRQILDDTHAIRPERIEESRSPSGSEGSGSDRSSVDSEFDELADIHYRRPHRNQGNPMDPSTMECLRYVVCDEGPVVLFLSSCRNMLHKHC